MSNVSDFDSLFSSEQRKGPWLFRVCRRAIILPSYEGIPIGSLLNNQEFMESVRPFFWLSGSSVFFQFHHCCALQQISGKQ